MALENKILSVQQGVAEALGGMGLPELDSVSLRLRKMVHIGQRVSNDELKQVCNVAEKNKKCLKNFPPPFIAVPGMVAFTLRLGGRMMVDQAGGVLENANLCLHRNLGFPMIPGSALKGIARHAAWCKWLEALEAGSQAEARDIAKLIAATFGYPTGDPLPVNAASRTREPACYLDAFLASEFPEDYGKDGHKAASAGAVSYLPAIPADGEWKLVVDVLNSHRDSDKENPIPVFFPAVERGAKFRFAVIPIMGRSTTATLNFAVEMLKCGLSINGAGAKTAAGYGWFDPASDERIADRSSCSQEELEAVYQVEVSGLPSIGLEEIVDSLDARDEHFQRLYLIRLMNEKASLLRKWEKKGNPRLKTVQKIAEKLNLELIYR
ncbi:type III-B CRISPR module RAMP protein Cmr6 [bacterium]|nr:type III-B CRISPR module RAMP protein Cmr6 [bacterium]